MRTMNRRIAAIPVPFKNATMINQVKLLGVLKNSIEI